MGWLTVLAIGIGVVLAVFLKGAADEKNKTKRLKRLIHDGFGREPDRDYGEEELSSIPGYYSAHSKSGQIDDITWNDLSMDTLYFRMNHTYSSAGQEYLYYMLRTGKAVSRNAIRLLGIIGYEEAIIKEAESLAGHFLETGNWT